MEWDFLLLTLYRMCVSKCVYVFLCPHYKQYLCCWNGSTTSGGQALYSILSTLKKKSIRVHLSCISHSIVVLQWDLFSSGRFNTWAGQWKECNRVGWREEGWGWGERERERRALWAGKQEEIARRKEVTLIQNEHIPPVFCTSWISLLDIFKIIQLSEIGYSVSTKGWELLVFKCVPTWFKYEDVWKYSIAGATI